ncbi:MAG: hypothetical protein ACREBS_04470, partial [Nitrososphaerales archaeon]
AGGFLSSVGSDIYSELKSAFTSYSGFVLSVPQIVFLLVGVTGLALIVSDLIKRKSRAQVRRNN